MSSESQSPNDHDQFLNPSLADLEADEIKYMMNHSVKALVALMFPVALTMILTGVVTSTLQVPDSIKGEVGFSRYLAFNDNAEGASGGERFGAALLNALILVGVVLGVTILMVALYYFRCMKIFMAWMFLSVFMLLGFTGGFLWSMYISAYDLQVDEISYYLLLWNLAVVGVIAVFWQAPKVVKGGYLVLVSTIMAWIVSFLPEWTSWAFIVLLAVYDICAVLSPCGPLKALIYLAQTRKEAIPALVYEVEVPQDEVKSPSFSQENRNKNASSNSHIIPIETEEKMQAEIANPVNQSSTHENYNNLDEVKQPAQGSSADIRSSEDQKDAADEEDDDDEDKTVKLGLGDFVFYSVLVARGAMFGWVPMISTLVAIISVRSMVLIF
jgi:presenilin 1